jgi:hypothetical protein
LDAAFRHRKHDSRSLANQIIAGVKGRVDDREPVFGKRDDQTTKLMPI